FLHADDEVAGRSRGQCVHRPSTCSIRLGSTGAQSESRTTSIPSRRASFAAVTKSGSPVIKDPMQPLAHWVEMRPSVGADLWDDVRNDERFFVVPSKQVVAVEEEAQIDEHRNASISAAQMKCPWVWRPQDCVGRARTARG